LVSLNKASNLSRWPLQNQLKLFVTWNVEHASPRLSTFLSSVPGYIPKGDPLPQVETVKGHQNQHQSTKEVAASSHKCWCSYFHTHGRRVSDEIKTSSFKLLIPSIFIDDSVGKPCLHKHLSEMYYPSSRNSLVIKVHPKLREQVPQASQQVPQAS